MLHFTPAKMFAHGSRSYLRRALTFCALVWAVSAWLPPTAPALAQQVHSGTAVGEQFLFPTANNVLAQFEFEQTAVDVSSSGRNGKLLGGDFVASGCGTGLQVSKDEHGFDWSDHAALLVHPYTIEMILTPEQTSSYAKLFSADRGSDRGWYYRGNGISLYPTDSLGQGSVQPMQRHYLAFVSKGPETIQVYFQGAPLGEGSATFTAPAKDALFFQDDTATGQREAMRGVVDALRISSVARSAAEIAAVQERVVACAGKERLFLPNLSN